MRRHYHCKGKKKFPTWECAEVTRRFRAARRPSWNDCQAYQCHICGEWHLGHKPEGRRVFVDVPKAPPQAKSASA